MTKDVNLDQLQKDAVEIFNQGFACSESIIYAIKKNFELEMSDDAIAMSSGFPWGLGGGEHLRSSCRWYDVYRILFRKKNSGRSKNQQMF